MKNLLSKRLFSRPYSELPILENSLRSMWTLL